MSMLLLDLSFDRCLGTWTFFEINLSAFLLPAMQNDAQYKYKRNI